MKRNKNLSCPTRRIFLWLLCVAVLALAVGFASCTNSPLIGEETQAEEITQGGLLEEESYDDGSDGDASADTDAEGVIDETHALDETSASDETQFSDETADAQPQDTDTVTGETQAEENATRGEDETEPRDDSESEAVTQPPSTEIPGQDEETLPVEPDTQSEPQVPQPPQDEDEPVTRPPVIDLPPQVEETQAAETQAGGAEQVTLPSASETSAPEGEGTVAQEQETASPDAPPSIEIDTTPIDPHPGDSSLYNGVMISAVYGTGKKNIDAAAEAGFVQLYNSNNKAVSLKGASLYYKSDGAKPYSQFVFPEDAVIPAKGYYLVRCTPVSGYDTTYAVMGVSEYDARWNETLDNREIRLLMAPTGWSVGKDDDILSFDDAVSVFYASDTAIVDHVYAVTGLSKNKVAVRTALKDYSGFNKVNLTERATAELNQIAPRTSDGRVNQVISTRLDEVYFSAPAGVYGSDFALTLSADSGFTVYYTTDGSDPTTSTTAKRYSSPISLRNTSAMTWGATTKTWSQLEVGANPTSNTLPGGYVVKAYATDGTTKTPVYTNTYFINNGMKDYGVSVVSLSIPVSEMLGDQGFYNNFMLEGTITGERRRGLAVMEVFDPNGVRVGYSNVEMAVSGNGSSGHLMKSLRLYYKSINNMTGGMDSDLDYDLFGGYAKDANGNVITSFDRLLLRNSGNDCLNSYIRDAYMQRVAACTNVDTMATVSTLVFINGEFWGVYNIRERYSPEYVESHYGVDKNNVSVVESDYSQVHTNHNADYVDSSGVVGGAADFNALIAYIDTHNLADPTAYAYVCDRLDIDSFIDMWAVRCYFNARDWPENNIKIWKNMNPDDPSGFDTKWYFTLLDLDMGLAYFPINDGNNTAENANFLPWFIGSDSTCGRIMRGLLNNASFRDKFIVRYYEIITEVFTEEYLSQVFERMVTERTPLMILQQQRWGNSGASVATWNSDVSDIRSFIRNRQGYALSGLYDYFGVSAQDIENMSYRRVTVSYNTARADVSVNGMAVSSGTIFRFTDDRYTFSVTATAKPGYLVTAIVYTDVNGNSQRVEGQNTATFTITTTGTITVYASRDGSAAMPEVSAFVAGPSYLFYLTESGDLYAWGDNRNGVLGLNASQNTVSTPTLVMQNVAKVDTTQSIDFENGNTEWMTAVLTKDGKLYTVGANGSGQLGRNGTTTDTSFGLVSFDGAIVDISVGHDHMLILDDQGQMWGVGNNSYGQLGTVNMGASVTSFQKVATGVTQISAGRRGTVFVDANDDLWGLGDNRWNKMSASHGEKISTPIKLLSDVAYVASGEHQFVAVTNGGDLYYAGWRNMGNFINGAGNNSPAVQKLMGGVAKADVYFDNMVILTTEGDAYVYGLNTGGGIGGSAVTGGTPQRIYQGVLDVTAGFGFTAYLCEDGSVRVLGDNTYGQAGNGTTGGSVFFAEADV